jgi:hypothetical protein
MTKTKFASEEEFNRYLVTEYLKYLSVDEVFRKNRYSLPISYASYQRVLDKWGVVKAAGPNNKLTEAVEFFSHLAKDNILVDDLYRKTPPSFQTSIKTLYRILSYIKEGITRRVGTALVITPYNFPEKILLAKDISAPNLALGKSYGAYSLPMGYSRKRDSRFTNVLRILQNEVFSRQVVEKKFPKEIIPQRLEPFMYLDIADVRVGVYQLFLPKGLTSLKVFNSYKLKGYNFFDLNSLLGEKTKQTFRAGVVEIARGYKKYLRLLSRNLVVNPLQGQSLLNKQLAEVAIEVGD